MKLIPSFGEFATKGKQALKRFPITLSWAIIGTLFTVFAIEYDFFDKTFYGKTILTFILGISWLIATRFFEEQFKKDREWIFLITIGFLVLFYTTLPSERNMNSLHFARFALYFIAGHLLVFVAPFILKYNKNAYFNYLKTIFIAIVRSLFFSLILYLGIVLALLAIKHLFNVDFKGERYFQVFVICLGIVNTWIYTSDFPLDIHSKTQINYTKALEVLVKYILIPLVILYLVILYAYSLKIVFNWNLPKGWVSYLVVALSFLGFVIQLLINPVQKTINSRVIRKFYPWFYILLLPLIALLFVAIFRRISDYGITENRYFVLVLACWIFGMTLYMLISKNKKVKWFPLSLSVLALLISFGFWGAFSVSTKSQVQQFSKVLNEIKATDFTTSHKKKNQLESIARYLSKKDETDKLSKVLGYNPKTTFKNENSWSISSKIIDSLNIKIDKKLRDKNRNYYYNINENNLNLNITGYDAMQHLYCYRGSKSTRNKEIYEAILESKSNTITLWKNNEFIESIDCSALVTKLLQQDDNQNLAPEFMTIEKGKFKLVFQSISINPDVKDNIKRYIYSANAYLLIKE